MSESQKIKKISASDQVYDALKQLIVSEQWKAGEKIPTEMQLSETYGVNRLTVRVALQRLQAIGLLDIRVGDGTYIKDFDMCSNILELSAFYSANVSHNEIREYRYYIENTCLVLALQRRTDEDLRRYWDKYQEMLDHVNFYFAADDEDILDKELMLQADLSLDIHTILCDMAHNQLLNYAFAIVKGSMRQLMLINIVRRMLEPDTTKQFLKCYEELGKCLESRDSLRAGEKLKEIIDIRLPEAENQVK